jgi:hypothetical protein
MYKTGTDSHILLNENVIQIQFLIIFRNQNLHLLLEMNLQEFKAPKDNTCICLSKLTPDN